jgi:hypothetical protein
MKTSYSIILQHDHERVWERIIILLFRILKQKSQNFTKKGNKKKLFKWVVCKE